MRVRGMKQRILATLLVLVMVLSMIPVSVFAETTTPASDATVYVTIADAQGKLAVTQAAITVTDRNSDGQLTIDEALYAAHEAKYTGGAAAGYASAESQYGLSLTKLWGTDNGGSYGYYLNNASPMSLADTVSSGDYLTAFVYTDLSAWSDTFCYFNKHNATAEVGKALELTLTAAGFDSSYNPITVPVEGATITVNGAATEVKTDAQGKAAITLDVAGTYTISATSATQTLVPPVCVVTAKVTPAADADVYVTIADGTGKLVMIQQSVTVTDKDKDGKLTIDEALYAAHEAKYPGGAAAGYGSYTGEYGLSMSKLWGNESGSYGYYVNNKSAWSLADTVAAGNYINAFVYTDATAWSDTYCFFDKNTATAQQEDTLELTLSAAGYDASYNPITVPVEGATITIDGVATSVKTNAEGKATITLDNAGTAVISATSETQTLVPPVCVVTVDALPAATVTVDMTVQASNSYLCAPQFGITVSGDLAESYGYTDTIPAHQGVTTLDVLVKAHEIIYGDDFNAETASTMLEVSSSGWASNVLGLGGNFSFAINGEFPYDPDIAYGQYGYTGYMINQAPVASGDLVEFFHYQDTSYYMDYYTWFEQDGSRVSSVTATAGTPFTLNLQGYIYAYGGSYVGQDRVNNGMLDAIPDAQITTVTIGTGATTDIANAMTDEDGNVSLTFSEAGTYYISAYTDYDETYQYILLPLLKVTVSAPVAETPKLDGFTTSYASWGEQTFKSDTYTYDLTIAQSRTYESIKATFDAEKYTASYSYNNGAESGNLTSGTGSWLWTVPYGESTLTVTVKEITGEKETVYTFNITRPRSADSTLYVNYGGIYVSSHNNQKLQPADATGVATGEAANASEEQKFYYVKLADDAAQTFKLGIDTNSSDAHKRYSVDEGQTWKDFDGYNTFEIQAPAKVIIQILSDAAYYEGTEGWNGKETNQFTVWVAGKAAEEGPSIQFPGSGTEGDPYRLENAAHLDNLNELVSDGETFEGKYFKITADITLNSGWDGIGYAKVEWAESWGSLVPSTKAFKPFAGILDGQGHTLTFPAGSMPLFDCVRNATIKNFKIKGDIADDGLIANYAQDGTNATATISGITVLSGTKIAGSGLLGGYASGSNVVTITDCHIEAGVTIGSADASNIGGIAGDFNGTISNSTCAATVYGKDFVGGIVAGQGQSMSATVISGCTFSGKVIASGNYVGGISGCGYTGTGWGFSNNAGCIDIKDCTVTGSVTGGDYVGGILGAEPAVMQCWENGSGEISNNKFTGTISSSGKYVGGVIGYMKSINRFNIISGNSYKASEAVTKGIGGAAYVDTNCANPTAVDGVTYVNSESSKTGVSGMSKTGHNRTDDPLGADADNLAREIEAPKKVVSKLEISGNYKTAYIQGEKLDLSKATFTATWSDGSTTHPTLADITVQGYDAEKLGSQKILLTFGAASCEITVTVEAAVKTITVTFSMLGDSAHGDNGSKHTLVDGNLTAWISKTSYTVDANATVLDVFREAAKANGVTYVYSNNYISSVTKGGVTLAAFTNGANSGWMYTLNGAYSDYGVSEQHLKDGDVIIFHYTDDYDRELGGGDNDDDTAVQEVIGKIKAIGTVSYTNACKQKIDAARKAYDALSFADKKKVTNLATLEAAEKAYADLKKADDQKKADAVDVLINKIDTVITLDSEQSITAARSAYNKLTADQKALVKNYKKLTNAETKLSELKADDEDKEKAQAVFDMIDKLGRITAESEDAVKAARAAYDKLTDIQKALVVGYAKLEAAEAELERLAQQSKYEDAYKTTGDYLGKQDLMIGSEWAVVGLIRSGHKVDDSFYKTLTDYIAQTIDSNNRLHNTKSTENAKMILVLTAMGKDATNVEGYNLVAGLNAMEYIQKQGINGPIFALIALDSGNYASCGDVTREALIQTILDAQLLDGGWALSGEDADADVTGMALQALASYYGSNSKVKAAVDKGIDCLSKMQNSDGGFSTGDSATAESVSQVIVALTALGIDPDADERFVKNGSSAVDALLTYYVTGGGFKHIQTGDRNGLATEQGYYALVAYARFLNGETALYDMTDILDKGGDSVEPTQPEGGEPTETVPSVTEPATADDDKGGFPWLTVIVVVVLGAGLAVAVVFSRKKVHK